MTRYRVILPVEIDGVALQYGQTVDLDDDTAERYAHALIAVREGREGDGGHE